MGAASGLPDEAMLPLLAKLTSQRLGLLTFLRDEDIRQERVLNRANRRHRGSQRRGNRQEGVATRSAQDRGIDDVLRAAPVS